MQATSLRVRGTRFFAALAAVLALSLFAAALTATPAQAADSSSAVQKKTLSMVLTKGMKSSVSFNSAAGKVKCKVSGKSVVSVKKLKTRSYRVTGKKPGKATLTFSSSKVRYTYKVTVMKKGKSFVTKWSKAWVKNYVPKKYNSFQKAALASFYVTGAFKYGSSNGTALDTICKNRGTCVGGSAVVKELLKAMGIKSTVRFAARDKMSRYPTGTYFASQHYNVKFKVKGKYYYTEGTPGSGMCYLSTSKAPFFSAYGGMVVMDKRHLFS